MKVSASPKYAECNKLWEYLVKCQAGWRCEMCGSTDSGLHAAHIIGRRALWTRWLLRNGLGLCPDCHDDVKIAKWLRAEDPVRWRWIVVKRRTVNGVFRLSDLDITHRRLIRKSRIAA